MFPVGNKKATDKVCLCYKHSPVYFSVLQLFHLATRMVISRSAYYGNLTEFDASSEDWNSHIERLEFFLKPKVWNKENGNQFC